MVYSGYTPPTQGVNPLSMSQGQGMSSTDGGASSGLGTSDILDLGSKFGGDSFGLGGVTGAINTAGANIGFGGVTPGFIGPTLPGTGVAANAGALSSTSLSGVLGPAAIGAFGGGLLADWTGGNATGGSIGGGLGGGIAAAAGLGPIGIGAAILGGGLLGGAFGGKPSNKQQVGVVNMDSNEIFGTAHTMLSQTGKKYSETNASLRDTMESSVVNFQKFLRDNGATLNSQDTLILKVGERDGLAYSFKETPDTYILGEEAGEFSDIFKQNDDVTVGNDTNRWTNEITAGILERHDIPEDLQYKLDNMDIMGEFFRLNSQGGAAGGSQNPRSAQAPMIQKELPASYNFQNFLTDYNSKQTPQEVNQANPLT